MNISIEIEENNESPVECDMDLFIAKQLDYQENYKLSDLKKIAEYYDILVRKLKKNDIIQEIVIFESDPDNAYEYNERLQAWYWLGEFSNNPKLKKYIIFKFG